MIYGNPIDPIMHFLYGSYMGPTLYSSGAAHMDPHGAMLHPLYGSLMGSPYGTHIETHVGPIWVPYTLFAG